MVFWLSTAFLLFTILFSLSFGASPERIGALVLVAMSVITFGAYAVLPRIFAKLDPVALTVDLVGVAGFAVIALRSRRFWPLWATAFQILSIVAHLIRVFDLQAGRLTYSIMKTGPSYMIMLCLIIGTINHLCCRARNDNRPYWRSWSAARPWMHAQQRNDS